MVSRQIIFINIVCTKFIFNVRSTEKCKYEGVYLQKKKENEYSSDNENNLVQFLVGTYCFKEMPIDERKAEVEEYQM